MTDQEIVEGCISGKPKYQQILYQRFAGPMLNICKRYTRTQSEAEDMLQDVFVKVFLNIHRFRFESTLGYWIKRLTVNTLISNQRKKNVNNNLVDIEEMAQELPEVTVPADATVPMDVLLGMIRELPEGYRTIFNMREIDGYDLQEIAEIVGCSNSTVRSQLFKAKNVLKKKVEEWLKTEIK